MPQNIQSLIIKPLSLFQKIKRVFAYITVILLLFIPILWIVQVYLSMDIPLEDVWIYLTLCCLVIYIIFEVIQIFEFESEYFSFDSFAMSHIKSEDLSVENLSQRFLEPYDHIIAIWYSNNIDHKDSKIRTLYIKTCLFIRSWSFFRYYGKNNNIYINNNAVFVEISKVWKQLQSRDGKIFINTHAYISYRAVCITLLLLVLFSYWIWLLNNYSHIIQKEIISIWSLIVIWVIIYLNKLKLLSLNRKHKEPIRTPHAIFNKIFELETDDELLMGNINSESLNLFVEWYYKNDDFKNMSCLIDFSSQSALFKFNMIDSDNIICDTNKDNVNQNRISHLITISEIITDSIFNHKAS